MSVDVNQNVEEVVQPTETADVQDSHQEETQEHQKPQKGSKEFNFRELERKLEEERLQRLRLEEYVRNSQQKQQVEAEDDSDDDVYVSRKQVEAIALRKAEELLQQQNAATLEDRTRLKFKDYDDVVNEYNIKQLIEDDPDLIETLKVSPQPYATAYKLIKKSAFYQVKSEKRNPDAEKILKNTQKPVSSNAIQARPLAQASSFSGMSQGERDALWKEMQEAASRR